MTTRCCILGGGGFIGTNLAKLLARVGWSVRVFGRSSVCSGDVAGVERLIGEFTDAEAVRQAVAGCDIVFHLIGATNPVTAEKNKILDLHQNVECTLRLLDLGVADAFGQIVFLSSGGTVYGIQGSTPIHEDSPQWPISSYGVTKMAIERYLYLYSHLYGLNYKIARVSNPFGEYQHARKGQGVVAALIHCALSGEPFDMVGDGSVIRDYIYIGDVVAALHAMTLYSGEHRIFNVASGIGLSLSQMVGFVECATGHRVEIRHHPGRTIDVPVNILDIGRATAELGWIPQTLFDNALRRTVDWAISAELRSHTAIMQSEFISFQERCI